MQASDNEQPQRFDEEIKLSGSDDSKLLPYRDTLPVRNKHNTKSDNTCRLIWSRTELFNGIKAGCL